MALEPPLARVERGNGARIAHQALDAPRTGQGKLMALALGQATDDGSD
jgi:hypothetical protein